MEKSFKRSAGSVVILMLIIKVIGFIKQAVIASCYGTSISLDVYFVAYGLITACTAILLRSLSVATIGVYGNMLETSPQKTDKLISTLINYFVIAACIVIGFIIVFSNPLSNLLASNYKGETHDILVKDIIVLSPLLLFSVFELILGSVLNARKNFLVPRTESLIYSVVVIILCILLSKKVDILALIIVRFAASLIYATILIVSVKGKFKYDIKAWKFDENTKWVFKKSLPLILGNGITQINLIIDKTIATGLKPGAVSALSYGQTLSQLVVSVFIVEVSSILFASFTSLVAKKEYSEINSMLSNTIKTIVMLTVPIAIVSVVASESIVKVAFFRGSFTLDSVEMTKAALLIYAIAFPFIAIKDLFVQSSYAFLDTKRPMINGAITVVINTVLSIILSPQIGIWGIAIGTTVADIISAFLAFFAFKKVNPDYKFSCIKKDMIRYFGVGIPAAICSVVLKFCLSEYISDIIQFFICFFVCFIVYFGILILFFRENTMMYLIKKIKSVVFKT